MDRLDWNLIPQFLKVYELNSISKAAEALNLSQPAVSLSVKRLEESLNKQLFIRQGRKIKPTVEAKELYLPFSKMWFHYESAVGNRREMVVYASEIALNNLPNIEGVKYVESIVGKEEALERIRHGQCDLLIDFFETSDHSLMCEKLSTERIYMACRKELPEVTTIEQFNQLSHVVINMQDNSYALDSLTEEILTRNVSRVLTSPSNLLLSAYRTNSVCAVCESMIPLAREIGLDVRELPFATRSFNSYLIYHRRISANKSHQELRDTIKSLYK